MKYITKLLRTCNEPYPEIFYLIALNASGIKQKLFLQLVKRLKVIFLSFCHNNNAGNEQ